MRLDTVKRYSAPVPRYTSYPTAPHFTDEIGASDHGKWLSEVASSASVSLYIHLPFCDSLCWFCGCHTKMVRRYEPVKAYLESLMTEMRFVARHLTSGARVRHIHWGGGSPDILCSDDIERLAEATRCRFTVEADGEFAVEIDPRQLEDAKVAAFVRAGVTRVSIGVQDFDADVQRAINREQSFDVTRRAVQGFRDRGVSSVNIDLVYGLPHQTRRSVGRTLEQIIELDPDRISLFGYAHLPARLARQRMIPEWALPDTLERFAQSNRLANRLVEAGYQRVGLDHFARPGDALAKAARSGTLQRNFQGYTTDEADALIGLGASAIGSFAEGYVQNTVPVADYQRRIAQDGLATVRGYRLSETDKARAFVISRLMCELKFPKDELQKRFARQSVEMIELANRLVATDQDGLLEADNDGFEVTERGRAFIRSICAHFDAHIDTGLALHSSGV